MKRFGFLSTLFLVSFIFVFSVSFVSADSYKCDDGQTIFRISDVTNAHGEQYIQGLGIFTKEICYNEIFGKNYSAQGNVHNCGTNIVLRLQQQSNSHAAIGSYGQYPTRVCFGDLVCTVSHTDCAPGQKTVVELSGDTNAHLQTRDGNSPAYTTKICCSSAFAASGAVCGNGIIEQGEQCDPKGQGTGDDVLGTNTCSNLNQGFNGGTLSCKANCELDTSLCTTAGGGGGNGGNGNVTKGCITRLNQSSCNVVNETNFRSILKDDPSWRSSCDNGDVACSCNWDANNGNGGVCNFRRTSQGTNDNGGTCDNTCDSTSTMGQCIGGYLTLNIVSKYNGNCQVPDPTCKNEQKTLLCGSPTLKLPFFGNMQAIAVIIAIALIYALAAIKNKK